MATPKTFTDNSTDLDEANLNLFLRAGKPQVKVNYFTFLFTAATNVVTLVAGADSDGEVIDADLIWNACSVRIDVTLSGFTAAPVVLATMRNNAATNVAALESRGSSSSQAQIQFMAAGANPSPVDPDANVDGNVLIIGV